MNMYFLEGATINGRLRVEDSVSDLEVTTATTV
jgi:hypothetical protein